MKSLIYRILRKLQSPVINAIEQESKNLDKRLLEVKQQIDSLSKKVGVIYNEQQKIKDIAVSNHDRIAERTEKLFEVRKTAAYSKAFEANPLVSIRIATYNRSDDLVNKAIASALKQTYQNIEVVVVGDHCTDDTEAKVKEISDKRVRFYNLPSRMPYPEDRMRRWQVVGVHPKNFAADMAKGQWIATLDDDDEMGPDQIEKLVKCALDSRCELVYGAATRIDVTTKKKNRLWSFPPERGQFTFNTAIYMKALDPIFKSDIKAWALDEVHDWTMCRQMLESGVLVAAIEDNLGMVYMTPPLSDKKDY